MVTQILKFAEKHSERFFDASTLELEAKAYLLILRSRDGYYYQKPSDEPYIPKDIASLASVEDKVAEILPEQLRVKIAEAKEYVEKAVLQHQEYVEWWTLLRETLDSGTDEEIIAKQYSWTEERSDGTKVAHSIPAVEYLIAQRSDHQYEGYEIITLPEL